MDTAFAIKYNGGAILAVETTVNHSILKLKTKHQKTFTLNSHCIMSLSGDMADREQFGSYIQRNVDYFRFKNNGRRGSVRRAAEFTRGQLAEAIRKSMKKVFPLVVGYDDRKQAQIYWIDNYGAFAEVDHTSHGYAAYFITSILNTEYRKDLTEAQAGQIVQKCVKALKARFLIPQEHFDFFRVDVNGVQKLNKD